MKKSLYRRFYKLAQYFLYQMENFYGQFYQYPIPPRPDVSLFLSRRQISHRLQAILNYALQISESYFNLTAKGSIADRCRRVEQAGWDWIYREELKSPQTLAVPSRKLADRIATEADLRMWHMRLVENFVAVSGTYIKDRPTIDRFAETTLILWDLLAQIEGRTETKRPYLGARIAQVTVGTPIDVSARLDRYLSSRRQAKQEVEDLTGEVATALHQMIR
jgi:hypothetical protein